MIRVLFILLFCATLCAHADSARDQRAKELRTKAATAKARAWAIAKKQGWAPKSARGELMAIEGGRVWMRRVENAESAITIADNLIRFTLPYQLSGTNLIIGFWDQALVRSSHVELTGRVVNIDAGGSSEHASSVAGTLAAAGINVPAMGMSPRVTLECYEWTADLAEITVRAMAAPGEAGKLPLSNHSYDYSTGWDYPRWYGISGMREDTGFGIYDDTARSLDVIAYNAPYYLQVKAAGNDRDQPAPIPGQPYQYWNGSSWALAFYDALTGPYPDGFDNGGYDTIPHEQNAKNILVVGAVGDAITGGVRDVASAQMMSYSDWGPTDDGRIKPDVVADGENIYTVSDLADNTYATDQGTSYAAPAVCGVAALLVEFYAKLFPQNWMRASTLKGLIIHTADDLGRPGPDYQFGWGLVDAQAAAEQLRNHALDRTRFDIVEDHLDAAAAIRTYYYVRDDTNDVRVTLSWTDPPGPANTNNTVLDDPTPRLVHDLDMMLVGPDGITNQPWVLDGLNPTNNATTGDNNLDNVEQIDVPAPPATGGLYRLVVSIEGSMTTNRQDYSLLVSGLKRADEIARFAQVTNGVRSLTWNAATGTVYDVLASDNLNGPAWTPLGTVTAVADSASILDSNVGSNARYYQLRVLNQP